jgi:hypothetical protein
MAFSYVLFPSTFIDGKVTIPTVIIFFDLASFAISGLTPEPVPFPNPAIINKISVSSPNIFSASDLFSSNASLPTIGSPPLPKPFNFFSPIKNKDELICDLANLINVFLSVLNAQKLILRGQERSFSKYEMILFPAPPTPNTLTFGKPTVSLEISKLQTAGSFFCAFVLTETTTSSFVSFLSVCTEFNISSIAIILFLRLS